MPSTKTDKNKHCFRLANRHSIFGTFPIPFTTELPQTVLPTACMWVSVQISFKRYTGSSMFDHDVQLCRGRRIQISGHSDFENLSNFGTSSIRSWVQADTASAACPAESGNLAVTSITFAAVICDADEPCSVNTAYEPESSFTVSPRSTTRPLNFEGLFFSLFCASRMTSFLLLTLVNCHAGNLSSFPHSLSTATFASRFFIESCTTYR